MSRDLEAIVNRQILRWNAEKMAAVEQAAAAAVLRPVVAVSRQLGSGGAEIAADVASRLECEFVGYKMVNEIAERTSVCDELMRALDEHTRTQQQKWIDAMIRKWDFDETDFHRQLLTAVRALAEMGSIVILGRGACFIETERLKVNVRVVAPLEQRVERVMKRIGCEEKKALEIVEKNDRERKKFVKRIFYKDVDDPLNYDIVINTGRVHISCAAAMVESTWRHMAANAGKKDERQLTTKQPVVY
jgi:cytidylate kinase